ncbi:MAG: recombinase RecA [Sedimentisphaerales bacterium]|nr:recombinase RecA [Sedimentisphaerales bacterium]
MAKTKKGETEKASSEREAALERAIAQIEKQYGAGSIMKMDQAQYAPVEGISTGALSLDIALGGSGVPRGRITELFGPESSGKTTLALHVVANAQRAGGVAAFIDAEHALDTTWARKVGVDINSLLISQPDTGEQALDIAEMLVRSNAVDTIVVDSVAALVPQAELQGEMGQSHVGLQARLMSQALRKLAGAIHKSRTCLIFINQIRMKIGVMFGNPETTTGGTALKFYSSIRVDIRRLSTIKDANDQAIGSRIKARVVKNKLAPPFRSAEFDIMFDSGINYEGDLIDLGAESGVIQKSGSWIQFGQIKLGQGRDNARRFLQEHPDITQQIRQKILEVKGLAQPVA